MLFVGLACHIGWRLKCSGTSAESRASRKQLPLVMGEDEEDDEMEGDDANDDVEQRGDDAKGGDHRQRAHGRNEGKANTHANHSKAGKDRKGKGQERHEEEEDEDEEHRAFLTRGDAAEAKSASGRPAPPALDDEDDMYVPLRLTMD